METPIEVALNAARENNGESYQPGSEIPEGRVAFQFWVGEEPVGAFHFPTQVESANVLEALLYQFPATIRSVQLFSE